MIYNKWSLIAVLLSTIISNPVNENVNTINKSVIRKENINREIKKELIIEENKINTEVTRFNVDGLILREGVSSEEVLRVKKFLKEKGYMDIKEDYFFGSNMKKAVVAYQTSNYLESDGIIGKKTYQTINKDMEINSINIPTVEIEMPEKIPNGDWIIINKTSNTLYHIKGKELINKYPVATGKEPGYTPEGKFTIVVKYKNPYWGGAGRYTPVRGGDPKNPLGKRWIGLSVGGGGQYGIHGNADKKSIGKFASLGCIRMFNEDVEYLYEIINKETPVWVGREDRLIKYGIYFN